MKKEKLIKILIFSLLINSCGELDGIRLKNYSYEIWTYYKKEERENLAYIEFFDSSDKLLRKWKYGEYCDNYYYQENKLIEIQRTRNCRDPFEREIFQLNSRGNQISSYSTRELNVNLDTIDIPQTKFYNQKNDLIREIKSKKKKDFELMREYENGNLIHEISLTQKGDTSWIKSFNYWEFGLLKSTRKKIGTAIEIEEYFYDSQNRLSRKRIKSNENVVFDNTELTDKSKIIFDNRNHQIKYEYKEEGALIIETKLNKNGKSFLRKLKRKKYAT